MRIYAAGIATETNTFSPIPTGLRDFSIQRGQGASDGDTTFDLAEIWGSLAANRGDEFIFSLMAWAQPAGITVRAAYESLRDEMLRDLQAAMPFDVVLLMLHGAMVAHGYEDCERDMIRRVRDIVGSGAVIGVELDLHCHLSAKKIAAADVVITYKKYPHDDINDRARELFEICIAAKSGRVRPTMALFDCGMIGFYPTSQPSMRGFVEEMVQAERRERVLSISFGHGFQFADVPHMGSKVLVITNDDEILAQQVAREFGLKAYSLRRQIGFDGVSLSMDEALSTALASCGTPVVVADQSDNVGAGAPGDSTFALRWLLEHGSSDAAIAIFYDPEVVKIAKSAGVGAAISVRLGGKLGPHSGDPMDLNVTVLSVVSDYVHQFPQQSGKPTLFPIGDVAALRCGSIDVVVSSERCQCYSPSIFTDLGIDPKRKKLLIPKSTQHFQGAFAEIADRIIYMSAPGAVPPDPRLITFSHFDTSRAYPWSEDPLSMSLDTDRSV